MLLNILLCTLYLVSVQSKNMTSSAKDNNMANNNSTTGEMVTTNKTNMPFVSEGGNVLPSTPVILMPKKQSNNLFSLEEEGSKEKDRGIVARKGAPQTPAIDKSITQLSNATVLKHDILKNDAKNSSLIPPVSDNIHKGSINKTEVTNNSNITEIPKKPMILSFEALAKADAKIKSGQLKIPVVPSTKTMASSQIPSPNDGSIVKVYPSKANSHPGMIMPIVITILVVPMFAIVGYMALKRGQEAWKNRHYKRMDFLLDGMYND